MVQPLVFGRKEVGDELSGQQGTLAKLSVGFTSVCRASKLTIRPWRLGRIGLNSHTWSTHGARRTHGARHMVAVG